MRTLARAVLLALALHAAPAAADDLAELAAAVERATAQYRFALRALETSGRAQTAAEVRLLREAWHELMARVAQAPAEFKDAEAYATAMTEIDARLVGALIVIDIGSRDAARAALAPVGESLERLRARTERR